eukprot:scaffold15059_cov146-Skeletonema_menzelii.AAC.10
MATERRRKELSLAKDVGGFVVSVTSEIAANCHPTKQDVPKSSRLTVCVKWKCSVSCLKSHKGQRVPT